MTNRLSAYLRFLALLCLLVFSATFANGQTTAFTYQGQLSNNALPASLNASSLVAFCSSSLRYKTDFAPYNRGLDIVGHLRPISFTWKEGGMRDFGFGAEEVAKVEPLLVTYNQQGQVEGVKYDRITAILVNAVNEQQRQIETLKQLVCADHPSAEICRK